MNTVKKLGVTVIATIVVILAAEVAERLSIPGVHSVISEADARVGRPLTPVSVAGTARRTVRRCAVGVYNC